MKKNSSSRRNFCNVIEKYFERGFWNQDSRIFIRRSFWVFQGLSLASCFVVVWILSSISSIFVLCHSVIAPSTTLTGFLRTLLSRGTGKGYVKAMRKLKVGTKLNYDPIIIHEWNFHLEIFLAVF